MESTDGRVVDSRSLLLQIADSALNLANYIHLNIESPDKAVILDQIELLRKRAEQL